MSLKKIITSGSCLFYLMMAISAQDVEYARAIIRKLSSPGMNGRGYVGNGEQLAAKYIIKEYKKIGLNKYTSGYQQEFKVSVNTFPGIIRLQLNGKTLVPGKDFLVSPESVSAKGRYNTYIVLYKDLADGEKWLEILGKSTRKFLILDRTATGTEYLTQDDEENIREMLDFLKINPDNPAAGTILITNEKLSWKSSGIEGSKPFLIVSSNCVPDEITTVDVEIENVFYESYQTSNVISYINGKLFPDSLIVFTAHYDHLGRMGKDTWFPGANDNASGVAMLLNLAAYYSLQEVHPDYSMAFIAFGAEELGLLGSEYFTEHPLFPLENISFLINIDLAGNGEDGITVVNGTKYPGKFELLNDINEANHFLPQVKARKEACNSDHCPFDNKGVPCFFIYTMGGSKAYHDLYDTANSLPLTVFENYFNLLKSFTDSLQVFY